MIEEVTTQTFSERVAGSDVPAVVDFNTPWCQPRHQIAPALEALAQQHDGVVPFTKVNIDEEPELAAYRASPPPAVLRFDSGVPTAWSLGPKPGYLIEKELKLRRVRKTSAAGDPPPKPRRRRRSGFARALRSWWGSR